MIIGLYDVDFARYRDKIPPNYTLMKYAAYHKKHRDIVKFLSDLKRADFYQKIYYNQDCLGDLEKVIITHPNAELSGRRIDGGIWEPLPLEVEKCTADSSIYPIPTDNRIDVRRRQKKIYSSYNVLVSTNEDTIFDFNKKIVFFHDYNIFSTPNWQERILQCTKFDSKIFQATFAARFPQFIPDYDALNFFSSIPIDDDFTHFRVDFQVSNEEFENYILNSHSCASSITTFCVNDKAIYTAREIVDLFLQTRYRYFFSRLHSKQFLLYNKGICINPNLDSFFDLLIKWNNSKTTKFTTFYDFIMYKGNKKGEESKRKLVRELFNQIKDLETYSKIDVKELLKKGGGWPYDK